jgi:hypothetical protein
MGEKFKITQNDVDLIDKILKLYPELKKEKKNIIDSLTGKTSVEIENEIVVEKFQYNNKSFYKNKHGSILDENLNLVGTYKIENGLYNYILFEEIDNNINELNNIKIG